MKALFIFASLVLSSVPAFAQSKSIPAQVRQQLIKSLAVRGAAAEAKRWAAAPRCSKLELEMKDENSFVAYVTCSKPGNPKVMRESSYGDEAQGQAVITGTVLPGANKDAPVYIMIEKIEFNYAG